MLLKDVIVTNRLPSGTCFGVTDGTDPKGVFIPQRVALACSLDVGDTVQAQLVLNTVEAERTPYFAIRVAHKAVEPGENSSLTANVLVALKAGGVWTAKTMGDLVFEEKGYSIGENPTAAAAGALASIFASGGCSKFSLLGPSASPVPRKEWFTCFPERADVDEWREDD
jgi:hypothetical protein